MKEDRLTYDELLKFNDEMIKDQKEFDKELRTRINKQRIIIAGEPAFIEKIYKSAREEGYEIAIFKPSNDNHIEHVPKKKKTFKKEFGYVKRKFR